MLQPCWFYLIWAVAFKREIQCRSRCASIWVSTDDRSNYRIENRTENSIYHLNLQLNWVKRKETRIIYVKSETHYNIEHQVLNVYYVNKTRWKIKLKWIKCSRTCNGQRCGVHFSFWFLPFFTSLFLFALVAVDQATARCTQTVFGRFYIHNVWPNRVTLSHALP